MRRELQVSKLITINTDPQRRCYNGCNFSEEKVWTSWDWLQWDVPEDKVEDRLKFWKDLHDYSVSVGGNPTRYRVVEKE